ncbi:MAG TPA: S8 family serine peptidase [Gemmatimonadales bacterium]|nr:S8 family serine peptidase [Gemmatimonadales bacterium]
METAPRSGIAALLALAAACTPGLRPPQSAAPQPAAPAPAAAPTAPAAPVPVAPPADALPKAKEPIAAPLVAYRLGLMPLGGTGVADWHAAHPGWDGRGTLIAILDSGVDPSVPGLQTTSTGERKILDLRDFSGEGDIALSPVHPGPDGTIALPGGLTLRGTGAVRAVAADTLWFGGVIRELPFGGAPAADFNGNGSNRDSYGVVVVRTASGWVAFIDTNGDGSLADETPIADYLERAQTFTFRAPTGAPGSGPIAGAVNLTVDASGRPRLSLVLDTAGHGTQVAGIAAGHNLYDVDGFDGVAPGAQVLGLKIADDARGGLSTTGSMLRAMEYAARFAEQRGLPLVLNMSFGIGNEQPGAAAMDLLVDAFLTAHPDVVFAISAGNDGPGVETMGLPGSAENALTVGSTYPGVFGLAEYGAPSADVMGFWSSRGGALDKPDIVTPGMQYSTVPRWDTGDEINLGTSFSSPHAAGMVSLLLSAMRGESRRVTAAQIMQALRATATPLRGETPLDQGYGVPQVDAAYRWLEAGHEAARFRVRAALQPRPTTVAGPTQRGSPVAAMRPAGFSSAAYRRWGLLGAEDTVQRFAVTRLPDGAGPSGPAELYRLSADQPWLGPVTPTVILGPGGTAEIDVRYDAARLSRPGRYVGMVSAVAAADTAAGTAFRLVSEIIVADSGQWRTVTMASRTLAPDHAYRYYVNVPVGAADLSVRVAVRDTSERGLLYLFEPGGRPARTRNQCDVGSSNGKRCVLAVTANDIQPGVWEAVVQAVPGRELHYAFAASVPGVSIVRVDSIGSRPAVSLFSPTAGDTALATAVEQIGIETAWQATVERGGPYRRTFAAPEWATGAVVEVRLTPEFWNSVTDFGIVLYDSSGAQLGKGAMNYAFHRVTVELPSKRPAAYPVTVELFPAFARPGPPPSFDAAVRLAFTGPPRALAKGELFVPAHGIGSVEIPPLTSLAPSPEWWDLVRVKVSGSDSDWVSIDRLISVREP